MCIMEKILKQLLFVEPKCEFLYTRKKVISESVEYATKKYEEDYDFMDSFYEYILGKGYDMWF